MKKVLIFILSLMLVLAACGNKQVTSKKEHNGAFDGDTLKLEKGSITIKDVKIVNFKEDNSKNIAFLYEVKNDKADDEVNAMAIWITVMNAYQNSKNTNNKLEVGLTPTKGKYLKWYEHSSDAINKGGTAKGIITYKLQNDSKVVLQAKNINNNKNLGKKVYDINKLTVDDYSTVDEINKEFENQQSNITSSDNTLAQDEQSSSLTTDTNNQKAVAESPQPQQTKPVPQQPKTQIEQTQPKVAETPTGGMGGHPSMVDPNIPPPSEKYTIDKDGTKLYDATQEFK